MEKEQKTEASATIKIDFGDLKSRELAELGKKVLQQKQEQKQE